jgi:hypothetical protein
MSNFEDESQSFGSAVKARAAVLVRDGHAAPYEAIDIARRQIMAERKAAARLRQRDTLNDVLGNVGKH